jgi:hypothetical protein
MKRECLRVRGGIDADVGTLRVGVVEGLMAGSVVLGELSMSTLIPGYGLELQVITMRARAR